MRSVSGAPGGTTQSGCHWLPSFFSVSISNGERRAFPRIGERALYHMVLKHIKRGPGMDGDRSLVRGPGRGDATRSHKIKRMVLDRVPTPVAKTISFTLSGTREPFCAFQTRQR